MSSILTDVKHKIGPSEEYDYYDRDIINAINEAFAVLNQLGAGPKEGFAIESADTEWGEYTTDITLLGFVQTYVYKKVQLIFDPPNNSSHQSAIEQQIDEMEWRINMQVEHGGNQPRRTMK